MKETRFVTVHGKSPNVAGTGHRACMVGVPFGVSAFLGGRHTACACYIVLAFLTAPAQADEPWKSVVAVRPFVFPRDHAAHEEYRLEWWYYTGNIQTDDGRQFGYELTFFRTGIDFAPKNPSRWAIRDLYVTHFAVSDMASKRLEFFERVGRRGVGGAGADADRYRVWNGDWNARLDGNDHLLRAESGPVKIHLTLSPDKPPALHGKQGLSQKGPTPGNASYYYSFTRMKTRGSVTVAGKTFSVTGQSWMDHEFSSSFLEEGQQGWDWFALQLDDGRELMLYQIRRNDGTIDAHSSCTLVRADGSCESLARSDFEIVPGQRWRSEASNAEYPIEWTVRIPGRQLDLNIRAAFAAQEMNTVASTGFPYWEGSIRITGMSAGRPVQGRGYLEMTGRAKKRRTP
jgi:predicted secreted hydrolase